MKKALTNKKIGFIGAGNMAEALISGLITSKQVRPDQIFISDIDSQRRNLLEKRYGVKPVAESATLCKDSNILILAVKPQQVEKALEEAKKSISSENLLISIAAGITTQKLATLTESKPKIVRAMPNIAALQRQGITALFLGHRSGEKEKEASEAIFNAVGKTVQIELEELMDAVTALSGSGPAYFFHLAELMVEGGIELGLHVKTATELVLQTLQGAATLARNANVSLAKLREQVTSPGGTTEAALKIFESRDLRSIMKEALLRAYQRGKEISK